LELQLTAEKTLTALESSQDSFTFPEPLTEKYRPRTIQEFVGLEKPKKVMEKLIERPFASAWFFLGPSGTGKSTFAQAIAEQMPAELHHIPSKECTLESVKEIARICQYCPRMLDNWTRKCQMHLVLVDEADQMSYPAQLAFLSLLDSTAPLPNTVIIFTGNDTANLEPRFMSRCRVLEFSSYGMSTGLADLLQRIWDSETDNPTERPNFARIVKDNANNARGALMSLETEIMSA
jgi:replication-associated recombination protein RarA